jgi:hypothetical protein
LSSNYEKAVKDAWANRGNGHGQATVQITKPQADPELQHAQHLSTDGTIELPKVGVKEPSKKPGVRERKKCILCGSATTLIRKRDNIPVWHPSRDPKKLGYLCDNCFFKKYRQQRKAREGELLVGIPAKVGILTPLFDRQNSILAEKQAAIKKRLMELEREKAKLLREAQELTEWLGSMAR